MKTDIQKLIESPQAMTRFSKIMREKATVIGLEQETGNRITEARVTLNVFRDHGLQTRQMCQHFSQLPFHILAQACAVGAERGARVGAEKVQDIIIEAQQFATNSIATFAPWLLTDDDW